MGDVGLSGYIQNLDTNTTTYGIYVLDPGQYDLVDLRHRLPHGSIPELGSARDV